MPHRFPVVATIAPVAGSVALWAITRSSFALVFALLGPLVAVASLVDSAWHARRERRRERERFRAEVAVAVEAIQHFHAREHAVAVAAHPIVRDILWSPPRDPERWRRTLDASVPVVVGSGAVRSTLQLADDRVVPSGGVPDPFRQTLDDLRRQARELSDARVLVDARSGIGICGPPALVAACARSILLQLANALSPADVRLELGGADDHGVDWAARIGGPDGPGGSGSSGGPNDSGGSGDSGRRDSDPSWLARLPHHSEARPSAGGTFSFAGDDVARAEARVVIAVASHPDELPRDCRTVIRIAPNASATLHPSPVELLGDHLSPAYVSLEEAREAAEKLAAAAIASGVLAAESALPLTVPFADIAQLDAPRSNAEPSRQRSLIGAPMVSTSGPLELDLVADGPHALIGGTTGSGKSELLVAWVLAMATRYGPEEVTFFLVDFKGGSAFRDVQRLPHSVGLITDLDDHAAHRALTSLRAELRYRERSLAQAGVRAIEQLPVEHPLSRLVVVVDEFAAMVADFPELNELFADLASRGRSLGIHLVLCTQRPAGVIRDAVLANCTLRVSLRVNNRADSVAVVGTGEAAELPRHPPGRALVSLGGAPPVMAQVALVSEADVERILLSRPLQGQPPRRPWCDPLPRQIAANELEPVPGAFALGLADLPEEQRQATAEYDPSRDGSMLVLGAQGAGKSGVLAMLARSGDDYGGGGGGESDGDSGDSDSDSDSGGGGDSGAGGLVERVPDDIEGAWDCLMERLAAVRAGGALPTLLLVDDVDALIGRYPEDYAYALVDAIEQLLREGGRCGLRLVLTARRLSAGLQNVAALCDSRLLLRMPTRQEHLLAGGEAADFDPRLSPGAGTWRGHRIQLARAEVALLELALLEVARSEVARSEVARLEIARSESDGVRSPVERGDLSLPSSVPHPRQHPSAPPKALSLPAVPPRLDWSSAPAWAVVTGRPAELIALLRRQYSGQEQHAGDEPAAPLYIVDLSAGPPIRPADPVHPVARAGSDPIRVFVGDPATWQSQWELSAGLGTRLPALFTGCSVQEFRALSRLRQLPPPLRPHSESVWQLDQDGALSRALPPWRTG